MSTHVRSSIYDRIGSSNNKFDRNQLRIKLIEAIGVMGRLPLIQVSFSYIRSVGVTYILLHKKPCRTLLKVMFNRHKPMY